MVISILIITIILVLAMVSILMTDAFAADNNRSNNTNCTITSSKSVSGQPTKDLSLTELFNAVRGSVVDINAITPVHDNLYINGTPGTFPASSSGGGTGFIVDTAGHVITNFHVVKNNTDITVTFPDGNRYPAAIIGEDSYTDLALLQVSQAAWEQEQIKPLPLGDSSFLQIGQPVVAVGSPSGATRESMTAGIISQINGTSSDQLTSSYLSSNLIEHSALIWHGNSGGPLLNMKGQVVGVNELLVLTNPVNPVESGPTGLGFSIPSNTVTKVGCQILTYGRAMHPYLGMLVGNMDAQVAQAMGGTGYNPRGVVVDAVGKIDPAGLAGIKGILSDHVLSVILSVDGKQVGQMSDLNNYVDSKAVGDNVVLTVFVKGGNPSVQNINVKLGERPAPFISYSSQAGAVNTLGGSATRTCEGGGHSVLGGAVNGSRC